MANPTKRRKRSNGPRRRNRKHNPFKAKAGHRSNRNPFKRRHRRRNPVGLGDAKTLLKNAAFAIGGGVLTRSLPQAVLGDKNTGIFGYAANAVTAIVTAMAAGKFFGEASGQSALLGGTVMLAGRILEDYLGRSVVEFGQVNLPLPRLAGDFQKSSFVVPYSSLGPESRPMIVAPPAAIPAAALSGRMGAWPPAWQN